MQNIFSSFVVLIFSIFFLVFGYNFLTKTDYMLQQYIKIFGINKGSYTYNYITDKKNIWHYKFASIGAIMMGIFLLIGFFIKVRE